MKYTVEKNGPDIFHDAVIEGVEIDDSEVLAGLKEFWAKIEETIGDLTDLDFIHVALAGEDGGILVWGAAKSTDISLNRQSYRLTIERMDHEWRGYEGPDGEEIGGDEFEIQTSKANEFYARLSEEARGDRFSSCDVRYYGLHAEDEGQII